jgi:DNA-binding transcriptional MerR regulator
MSRSEVIAPLWTVRDVAEYLQVPVQTLYFWRSTGYGPKARRIGKYLRYRPDEVVAWLDQLSDGVA